MTVPTTRMQDHQAFLGGNHDFQADIELIAGSETVSVILETVRLATGMRFAAVSRVTADRWVACRTSDDISFNLASGDEIAIGSTFCQTARDTGEPVVFDDVNTDEAFVDHPIARQFNIVSYVSIPIYRDDGSFFGTLCGIDIVPRRVKRPRVQAMFRMFADLIGRSLDTEMRLEAQEQLVEHERRLAAAREEFVAILGHDLRNPVTAFGAGLRQLRGEALSDRAEQTVALMRAAVLRMEDLIGNMLIHAKQRLGGGISVSVVADAPIRQAISQVVEEVRIAHPAHEVSLDLEIDRPVSCDGPRVAQAVSNLLANAVQHGREGGPIRVAAFCDDAGMTIAVTNAGPAVSDDFAQKLFEPFRRAAGSGGDGLGLGLYIASAIATAHNGHLEVKSGEGEVTFSFRLPLFA
ncbi:GAF domain-containing sensor histidine kinase [Marinovum algicola]|uniref:GAF domain-containing sensor histidine kinase n=1 Tax=Marinovum algicola TaxID=42444 RepID=UPI0024BB94A2|nr:GAF domain-containing sensor histidine kinase [Marinovum algicola]